MTQIKYTKRMGHLFEKMIDRDNLKLAIQNAARRKRNRASVRRVLNDIEKYRKMPLLVSRENAVELEEDEYYMADIIGMDVYTEDGEKFGVLADIMETGANDVYVVSTEAHTEVLLPAIHDCILDVDTENRKMTVHLMDGLI